MIHEIFLWAWLPTLLGLGLLILSAIGATFLNPNPPAWAQFVLWVLKWIIILVVVALIAWGGHWLGTLAGKLFKW